jgi:protein-L-isoaspartate(D-aspartate) O-methyltransferase
MRPIMDRDGLLAELRRQIRDERVLDAIAAVPRDRFVPPERRDEAWENKPLPIGGGQTISQPLVVARMCELLALRGTETVLDVGTGSGYHAAVLARLARRVISIERLPDLAERARAVLGDAVEVVVGDGARGHAAGAPYDAINVAAASAAGVPQALEAQLADGGRLVLPVADAGQRLVLVTRAGNRLVREALEEVRFVPLVS